MFCLFLDIIAMKKQILDINILKRKIIVIIHAIINLF